MGSVINSSFRDASAVDFNGTDEYAYRDDPSFKGDDQGAVAMWFRPGSIPTGVAFRVAWGMGLRDAGNNSNIQAALRWSADTSIGATYRSQAIPDVIARATHNGTFDRAYGNHIYAANTWVLWVLQSNGSAWTHWINGSSVGGTYWGTGGGSNAGLWLGDLSGSAHRFSIGSGFMSNGMSNPGPARLNEVMYFNRPLTSGEVSWLYNGGVPRNPHRDPALWSACRLWLRCGDSRDNGTTLFDESGYGNDFTLVNMDGSNYVAP